MSVAVTAITLGSAAGNSGGDCGPALPAAATSTAPRHPRQRIAQPRIGRPGKAHIDDTGAALDRPVEPLDNVERGAVGVVGPGAEGAHGEQPDPRSGAEHAAMRCDRTRHAGAVAV